MAVLAASAFAALSPELVGASLAVAAAGLAGACAGVDVEGLSLGVVLVPGPVPGALTAALLVELPQPMMARVAEKMQ